MYGGVPGRMVYTRVVYLVVYTRVYHAGYVAT